MKFGSLFTGFDGVGVGAKAAGLELAWGVENDPAIAEVARVNGHPVTVADVLEYDPAAFERVDVLHASPPCTRASVANHSAEMDERGLRESTLDRALATKTAEFVTVLRPRVFTLENVWGYRRFRSWAIIENALHQAGYWVTVNHLDAANFGVPQNRKRMIVRAVLGGWLPYLPKPDPWVGWYQAIEDLIPTLPESRFAPWQLALLKLDTTTLRGMRAFIIDCQYNNFGPERALNIRDAGEPMLTVAASGSHRVTRAFIVDGNNARSADKGGLTVRSADEPAQTVMGQHKASRAWLDCGRVVAMTPRCLARFQSFPDSFALPDSNRLAVKGIGNAMPPLWYEKIIRQLI